jgi:hypothetical protein
MPKVIVIILIFGFIQNAACEDRQKKSDWVYMGSAKWKISEKTTLDMEINCIDNSQGSIKRKCSARSHGNLSRRVSYILEGGYYDLHATAYENNGIKVSTYMSYDGVHNKSKYDSLGRVESIISFADSSDRPFAEAFGKGTVIRSERYIWDEKGRLVQMVDKGKIRNFIYGTPCDTVKVEPSDFIYPHFGTPPVYDRSFGEIPEESDPEYEKFKEGPYEFRAGPELLERQKARCEEYKESQKEKGGK